MGGAVPISLRDLTHLTGLEFERLCIDLLTIEYRGRYSVRAIDGGRATRMEVWTPG